MNLEKNYYKVRCASDTYFCRPSCCNYNKVCICKYIQLANHVEFIYTESISTKLSREEIIEYLKEKGLIQKIEQKLRKHKPKKKKRKR